jgi:hypothetical protein
MIRPRAFKSIQRVLFADQATGHLAFPVDYERRTVRFGGDPQLAAGSTVGRGSIQQPQHLLAVEILVIVDAQQ